jgi:hypothetical protein
LESARPSTGWTYRLTRAYLFILEVEAWRYFIAEILGNRWPPRTHTKKLLREFRPKVSSDSNEDPSRLENRELTLPSGAHFRGW